jgi:hypothetical protein
MVVSMGIVLASSTAYAKISPNQITVLLPLQSEQVEQLTLVLQRAALGQQTSGIKEIFASSLGNFYLFLQPASSDSPEQIQKRLDTGQDRD